jgi:hypothetical protein
LAEGGHDWQPVLPAQAVKQHETTCTTVRSGHSYRVFKSCACVVSRPHVPAMPLQPCVSWRGNWESPARASRTAANSSSVLQRNLPLSTRTGYLKQLLIALVFGPVAGWELNQQGPDITATDHQGEFTGQEERVDNLPPLASVSIIGVSMKHSRVHTEEGMAVAGPLPTLHILCMCSACHVSCCSCWTCWWCWWDSTQACLALAFIRANLILLV